MVVTVAQSHNFLSVFLTPVFSINLHSSSSEASSHFLFFDLHLSESKKHISPLK